MALIKTADDLAALLRNVRRGSGWQGLDWMADPPCHASSSHKSFHFGTDSDGVLIVRCWANCRLDAIERGIGGHTLALRMPSTGRIRGVDTRPPYMPGAPAVYREYAGWRGKAYAPAPAPAAPVAAPAPAAPAYALHCLPAGGRGITLADVAGLRRWFLASGKQGLHGWLEGEERHYGWRHIIREGLLPPGVCRVKAAAEGCVLPPDEKFDCGVRIIRQDTLPVMAALAAKPTCPPGVAPALSLAGSAALPYPFPLLALDCDYQPDQDDDGSGRAARDRLREELEQRGAAVSPSRSGNGWHALMLAPDDEVKAYPVQGRSRIAYPATAQGLSFDVFPPAAPSALVLRIDADSAAGSGNALCVMPVARLRGLVADACRYACMHCGILLNGVACGDCDSDGGSVAPAPAPAPVAAVLKPAPVKQRQCQMPACLMRNVCLCADGPFLPAPCQAPACLRYGDCICTDGPLKEVFGPYMGQTAPGKPRTKPKQEVNRDAVQTAETEEGRVSGQQGDDAAQQDTQEVAPGGAGSKEFPPAVRPQAPAQCTHCQAAPALPDDADGYCAACAYLADNPDAPMPMPEIAAAVSDDAPASDPVIVGYTDKGKPYGWCDRHRLRLFPPGGACYRCGFTPAHDKAPVSPLAPSVPDAAQVAPQAPVALHKQCPATNSACPHSGAGGQCAAECALATAGFDI